MLGESEKQAAEIRDNLRSDLDPSKRGGSFGEPLTFSVRQDVDTVAVEAMVAILHSCNGNIETPQFAEKLATTCYEIADAMVRESRKRLEENPVYKLQQEIQKQFYSKGE